MENIHKQQLMGRPKAIVRRAIETNLVVIIKAPILDNKIDKDVYHY